MPPRPEHDGSDWSFRMIIEDRYKRLVILRKYIRVLAIVATFYAPLRTAWHLIPYLLTGAPVVFLTQAVAALGAVLPLLYVYAFGFGKPHRERLGAIKVYSLAAFLLFAEAGLSFWQYHIMWPKEDLFPALLARRFHAGLLGLSPEGIKLAAQVFEAVLDVVGLGSLLLLVLATKEYIVEKRSQKREAEAKKD